MNLIDRARSLPLATRRALVGVIVVIVAVVGLVVWFTVGFGVSEQQGGIKAISEGAGSVAQLIQSQTDKYSETKAQIQNNLDQTLKSSALVLPESLTNVREEPDGVLFLQYQHSAHGTKTMLKDVTFYPSYTLVRATITNESDSAQAIDVARGSVLEQQSNQTKVSVQPLYQVVTPTTLDPGASIETQIIFGPLNGRLPFELVIGDYSAGASGGTGSAGETWSAQFSVDPANIVKGKD